MGAKTDFPVSVTLKAVDKATAPIRALTVRMHQLTAPVKAIGERFGRFSKALSGLSAASGLTSVATGFKGFGKAIGKVGSELAGVGARFAALGAMAGVVLWGIVKGAVDAGDKLGEMADRVGLTVDVYASLQHAAAQADVEQEAFNAAMDRFNKNLGEMTVGKGGEFLAFLNKVSPALAKQMKAAGSTEAALALMTDAFARIDDPAKSAALAAAAFGKSGLQMGRFLHQGSAAIQEQQRRFLELSGSQEAFARGAGELDNQLRETELAFTGLRNVAAGALFPAFTQLGKALTDFMVKNRDGIQRWATQTAAAIQKWIDSGGLERLAASVTAFAERAAWLIDKVGGLTGVLAGLALVISAPLISAIVAAIPAIYSLGVALLTTPVGWFLLAVAAIAGAAWLIYDNWDAIVGHFQGWFAEIERFITLLFDLQAALFSLDFDAVVNKWSEAVAAYKRVLLSTLQIMKWLPPVAIGARLFAASGAEEALAEGAAPSLAPVETPLQNPRGSEAKVSVDFANLPRGARVTADPTSTADLDLSLGYSMVTP